MPIPKLIVTAALLVLTTAAHATSCQKTMGFERWLDEFKKEAVAQGIAPHVLAQALPQMTVDPAIIRRDRGQGVFSQTFLQFSDRMVAGFRLQNGALMMKKHAALFERVEREFGVPAPVLTAFWGLESDFGANNGNYSILRSLTTLAYDCRRADFFRAELLDALRIVERRDQRVEDMIGDWAGEFGGMQITASDYLKNGVDYDGDGRRDVIKSTPDTIATAANFLKSLGWQAGQPWLQEVRVAANLPWQEADLNIQHPRSQWVAWGVRAAHGTLPADDMAASLLLPMGRNGPAFLAYPNFKAFLGWNAAMVYSTTVAYYATLLTGAPAVSRGGQVYTLSPAQMTELQTLLTRQGEDVGKIDGKFGSATRAAVKKFQIKFGLAADSYPSLELLDRLRGRGNSVAR
ncbi:MAG: lytic murein transglycosylase [Pseudolabrys sp.]